MTPDGTDRASPRPKPDERSSDADTLSDLDFVLVAAVAANGIIGREGQIPWDFPADLRRFKRITMGHPVIMGRRTFESIAADLGGPLPGRTNIVLSNSQPDLPDGVVLAESISDAIESARATDANIGYVIGGAQVYEAFLPLANRMQLTEIHEPYEGDTFFPDFDRETWRVTERDSREEFDFVTYERS